MSLAPETRVESYEIRALLEDRGVGEVYLAFDPRLDRSVALRILKKGPGGEPVHEQRFLSEMKAAAAISHPNVVQTFEAGFAGEFAFVAMEFVEGATLRQRLTDGRIPLREALYIAVQLASALVAVHQAGLIHLGITPESVLLGPEGIVKLTNIGLTSIASLSAAGEVTPIDVTPAFERERYITPEQYRGLKVDTRSDIWAFGVVLYKMVTGRAPFEGATGHTIKTSILHTDVDPPSRYSPEANGDVDRLIGKTLRRSRDERYQTADALLFDLRRLWQKMEIKDLLVNIGPQDAKNATTAPGSFQHISAAPATGETQAAPVTGPQTGSSAEYIFQEFKQHRIAALIAVAALLVVLAGGPFLLYRAFRFARGTDRIATEFESIKVGKLTTTGKATVAGISPDGKYAVHAVAASGKQSLWVRQVATTSLIQLIPPDEVEYQGITFSNDGNYIFYVVHNKDNPIRELHQMPVLGGTPRKIIVDIDSPVTFSPNGNQLAFVRRYSSLGEDALITADTNGQNERKLLTRKQPDFISTGGPAWSPNGGLIACAVGSSGANGTSMRVVGVKPETGAESAFSNDKWFRIGRVAWLKGGNGLMVNAEEQTLGPYQIWLLPFPSGATRKVTNDLGDYRGLSLAPESGDIVTVQWDQLSNIWTADAGKELSKDTQISSGKYDGFYGLSWTGDGKLVYATNASGTQDVWTMNPDGANQQQLTVHAGTNLWPSVSPDGRYIVFSSDRAGVLHIWRANRDGTDPRQLTDGNGEDWAHCSPDGKWVFYTSIGGNTRFTLWKVPIGGGSPVQLTDKIMLQPDVSPDGKFMACGYRGQFNTPWKLAVIPIEGSLPVKTFDIAPTVPLPIVVRWTPDGRELTYIDTNGGSSNLWKQSIDGGPPKRITNFASDQIFAFDWSPDGKQLAYSRGTSINDVVLISDAR